MSDRGRTSRLVRPLLVALLAALPVQAQIVTDGSVGSKVSLRGGKIEIGADLGTRRGANLFHSFEKFGITTGQTATFTGPVAIKNVISRVTGGEVSRIDGKLASTVGQADLYFLNPAGVMFGPNATLDVPGSFHVSTAHELRFADGVSFSALDKSGSGLTVAAPEAFGFLNRPPNRITVDQSQLQLKPGKTLSLVGGDLTIDGGETGGVGVEDGVVQLVSAAAPGTVRISDAATMVGQRGEVRVTQSADRSAKGGGFGSVDVSGRNSERTIRIRGGQVAVDGAWIFADNYGSPDSAGGIDVQADEILIRDGTVTADSVGPGKAGIVTVAAEKLELHGGLISSSTYGPGDAGQVTVNANRLLVGSNGTATFTNIKSSANTGSTGRAGTVAVTAREIELHGDDQTYGTIASSTFGYGNAGQVTISADRLIMRGGLISSTAEAGSTGQGGGVTVSVRELELREGGVIFSGTFGRGNAGQVTVNADRLLISRDGAASPTRITSSAQRGSTGWAGAVTVTARELVLRNGGEITSNTSATGNAGQVTVNADRLLISRDGAATFTGIASSANTGSTGRAGMVAVIARELELHGGGQIHSITFGRGNAGQVTVNADRLLVSGTDGARYPSLISSQANDVLSGAAGSVAVTARELELRGGAQITSSTFGRDNAGQVIINTDRLLISDVGAVGDPSGIFSSANLGSTGAGGPVNIQARTIVLRDHGAITTESAGTGPGGPVTVKAKDTLRLDNASIQTQTALATGGDVQISVGQLFDLHNSTVTTSVAGGTGSGGNIFIDPSLMVLDNSRIQANAKQGAGGNITIQVGQLIRTPDSVIQASSELGLSGTINIAAPNTDIAGSLVVLPETLFDASSQLREACAARSGRPGNSFIAGGRGGLPPDPGAPLPASSFGQPLEQQTATGLPTALTARPPQTAKSITVAGNPQPVLGSPHLTCRG